MFSSRLMLFPTLQKKLVRFFFFLNILALIFVKKNILASTQKNYCPPEGQNKSTVHMMKKNTALLK